MKISSKRINDFLKANSPLDLWTYKFDKDENIKNLKWPALRRKIDKDEFIKELKALQRLIRLTHDLDIAIDLYNVGFHSAIQIASLSEQQFVDQTKLVFNKDDLSADDKARQIYQRALARRSHSVLTYAAIAQNTGSHYRAGRFNNIADLTDKAFGDLPSYEDLFGNTDFCSCEECRSIYSPAAYFVDLMRIQARYIHIGVSDKSNSLPLSLQSRRPDLWELPLSCENTNTRVTKLSIANEVLTRALFPFYDLKNNYKALAEAKYPFHFPINLPLSELRTYLSHQKTSLSELWQDLVFDLKQADQLNIAREQLHLSPEQWELFSEPKNDPKILTAYYGLKTGTDPVKALEDIDVFLKQTGLSHTQLNELLFQNLSEEEHNKKVNGQFFINVGDPKKPIDMNKDGDKLENLTLDRLDHIHRFIRLSQTLNWSFADLDWALYSIGQIANDKKTLINDATLPYLAWIKTLHQELGLPIVQICAWIYQLKNYGQKDGPTFFQQIFMNQNVPLWPQDESWHVPEANSIEIDSNSQTIQTALCEALQISQDDLLMIAETVLEGQNIKDRKLPLSPQNLSILYRLSQLPVLTSLSIEQCFILVDLPGVTEKPNQTLAGPGDAANPILVKLKKISQWISTTNLSVGQLQYTLTGESYDKAIQNRILGIDESGNFILGLQEALQQVLLSEEFFANATRSLLQSMGKLEDLNIFWNLLLGKNTPDGKIDRFVDEKGLVLRAPDKKTIENLFGPFLDVPEEITGLTQDFITLVAETLTHFYLAQQETFNQHLAGLYNISPNLVPILKLWGGLTHGDFSTSEPLTLNVNGLENHIAAVPHLQSLVSSTDSILDESDDRIGRLQIMQRYAALMQSLSLSFAEAQSILENPEYYGISYVQKNGDDKVPNFTLENIQTLVQFKKFIASFQDTQNRLIGYFDAVKSHPTDFSSLSKILERLTQWNAKQIEFFMEKLEPFPSKQPWYGTVTGFALLQSYMQTASDLRIDLPGLIQITKLASEKSYDMFQTVAQSIWATLQKQQDSLDIQQIRNEVDERKRDALVSFALYKLDLETARQLYEYLLIDVSVSGAVTTSYVKEAISAVQLYINRCRNHLEPDAHIDAELNLWWSWLENYRVWHANREVFLYPENYIQPELRKRATPQFRELISNLNQADLTDPEAATTAIRTYMQDFAEIANLEIIGSSSHQVDPLTKQICFVGRTLQQPYSYYYRTATFKKGVISSEGGMFPLSKDRYVPTRWELWLDINLQIQPVGPLTPVFAFGKWFIFWVEQQKNPANEKGSEINYTATIYYSSLDFNQNWIAPQILQEFTNGKSIFSISTKSSPSKEFFDRVYPSFFESTQSMICPYLSSTTGDFKNVEAHLPTFGDYFLKKGIIFSIRHALKEKLPQANETLDHQYKDSNDVSFMHTYYFSNTKSFGLHAKALSLWIKIDDFPKSEKNNMYIIRKMESPSASLFINSTGMLKFISHSTEVDCIDRPLEKNKWYHIAFLAQNSSKEFLWLNGVKQKNPIDTSSFIIDYIGNNNAQDLFSGAMQEIIGYNRYLTDYEIKALYKNGKDVITQDFGASVALKGTFQNTSIQTHIIGQPNWNVLEGSGIEFLAAPYTINTSSLLECFRLNTTAIDQLSQTLFLSGIQDLLTIDSQRTSEVPFIDLNPNKKYVPKPWPSNQIDFMSGSMSQYYWELFFHAPFLVAHQLQTQQQFEAAKEWYEYIFNPTIHESTKALDANDKSDNDKYWRFLGLRSAYNPLLAQELAETWEEEVQADLNSQAQLADYHNDPFDPHAIARLRPIAYQKTIVMHYINNLLSWGDSHFRLYTIEDIVQATMIYIMAYDLLGEEPVDLGPCPLPPAETLEQLANGDLSDLEEFLIHVEQTQTFVSDLTTQPTPHNYIPGDYFGLPENNQFITYWTRVQQRLDNIRHGLNIDGQKVELPLFQPALDPMQLVNQVQSGENTRKPLPSLQVRTPYYRFSTLIQKAKEVTQTVTQLGQSLLSTLEKRNSADLTLLYNKNQQNLSALTRMSKQDQLEASTESLHALQNSLQNAQERLRHYTFLIDQGLSAGEIAQLLLSGTALRLQAGAQAVKALSVAGYLLPNTFGTAFGGMSFGDAIGQGANIAEGSAGALSTASGIAGTIAGYQRRNEDWEFQKNLAQFDVEQIQHQIVSAEYQKHIAAQDIQLLKKSIEQDQKVEKFLQSQFTNQELYQWMAGKLSALYFQAYQLAYDLALQAQQAWQFELGRPQDFIKTGHWNNLYQGLVAGESLQLDLQRMESTYMQQNQRTFEIEKTISLAQLDPQALLDLRTKGSCCFELMEADFDYDYIGHYRRQIKSVSLSFPAVVGAFQNIHATLTQTSNRTLLKDDPEAVKQLLGGKTIKNTEVIRTDINANQQVALSQELNDSGLFVLNFNDERYLPFEGTGAISSWKLEMPKVNNPFDFSSLTDVVMRIQYTALQGNHDFQKTVREELNKFQGQRIMFMAQEFSTSWHSFVRQGNPLTFQVSPALLRPNLLSYKIQKIYIQLQIASDGKLPKLYLTIPGVFNEKPLPFESQNGIYWAELSFPEKTELSKPEEWRISLDEGTDNIENITNMFVILSYEGRITELQPLT